MPATSRICFQYFWNATLIGSLTSSWCSRTATNSGLSADGQADEQADDDQGGAEQERDPPAPGQELLVRELRDGEERQGGQCGAGGGTHLRERPVQAAFAERGVLDGHQRGAAPLAADAEALEACGAGSAGSGPGCRSVA